MTVPDRGSQLPARLRGVDRGFVLLVLGAVLLIIIGLISIPLIARRSAPLAAANTPEGTVQRFYQAAYQGDWNTAYDFLGGDTQRQLSLAELQQQVSSDLKNSQMVVSSTAVHDPTATVEVKLTHTRPGGVFDTGTYSGSHVVLLQREGSDWKIISGPFYVQPKR
ncbi:MAG: hypothetical protein NVS2B7_38610 [Herpetosiphon sp.]